MDETVNIPLNAGLAATESGGSMPNVAKNTPSRCSLFDALHSTTAMTEDPNRLLLVHADVPVCLASTSEFSSDPSAYSADMDMTIDDDAESDSSGLFASALLSEEHIVLDPALLREMDELLERDGATQWNHVLLESPSLLFPIPGSSAPLSSIPLSTESQNHSASFVPTPDGWTTETSSGELDSDFEMDNTDSASDPQMKEMELMARQIKFLVAQREFLEYKASVASSSEDAMSTSQIQNHRDAIQEKRRLVESQLHQEMLTKLAKQQLENLKYVELLLLQTPVTHYRNTLMTPMASYIHLTRDPQERRATLLALRDHNIDATRRYIEFQSRHIDVERQFFYLDTFEKFGKFYTVDFSISKLDEASVDDVVNVIYNHFVSTKDTISQILGSVENREYFDGMEWTFLNARFVDRINLPKRGPHDRGFVVQESNTVYFMKKFGDTVIMTCDCIDKDDLHPYRSMGRIQKDKNVGIIVEPFVDAHGKQSVLLKRFSFIRHHFKNIASTPELIQAISTKVILWGQAVRFCLANRMNVKSSGSPIDPQLLARATKLDARASVGP